MKNVLLSKSYQSNFISSKSVPFSRYPHVPWDFTSVESYKEGSEPEQNDVNALLASPSNEKNANSAETNGKANGVETEVKYKLAMTKVFISLKFKTPHRAHC